MRTDSQRVRARRLGAVLGISAAPGGIYAAWWSGVGDAGWYVWCITMAVAALLGALTWPVFIPAPEDTERPSLGFAALFSGTVGLLAGTLVAFPMGGVFGSVAGALGGPLAALAWTHLAGRSAAVRGTASASAGGLVALGLVAWWLA